MMQWVESGAQSLRSALQDGRPADSVEVARLAAAVDSMLFGVPRSFAIGRYRIVRPIGEGTSGVVYEAVDPDLGRSVALKLLRTRDPACVARLRHETHVLARVDDPRIVRVLDSGVVPNESGDGQRAFVVSELVHGTDIVSWCIRQPYRARPAVAVAAIRAIAAAHRAGVTHCDLKPEHLIVDAEGRPTVIDFGLAHARPDHDEGIAAGPVGVGTPGYMAPEVAQGAACDARSDQFALSVTLWEALFGRHPFGEHGPGRVAAIEAGRVDRRATGSRGHARVLRRGLARDPARRWPTLDAMADALVAVDRDTLRWRWFAAVLAIAIAIAAWVGGAPW